MTDDDVKLPEPVAWYDSKTGWVDFTSWRPVRNPSGPDAKWLPLYDEPTVRRLIAEAQAEERERCAVLCEARRAFALSNRHPSYAEAADDCATAIRNRSKA